MGAEELKRRKAVALNYDGKSESAPRVVAKGAGHVAERIIVLAHEHGVEIYEDPDLVDALTRLDLDAEIPESHYRVVAEVLAFIYRLNHAMPATAGRF